MTAFRKRVWNGLRRRFDRWIHKLGKKYNLSLALVNDYAEFGGLKELCTLSDRYTLFSAPLLYDRQLKEIRQSSFKAPVPDVHLLELTDVGIIGATMAVIRNGKVLHPELLRMSPNHDYKAPDIYRFSDDRRRSLDFYVFTKPIAQKSIEVGIHLLKEHSFNYYHWLFECLPRLIHYIDNLDKMGRSVKYTVLVDDGVLPQCMEAVRRLISFNHKIRKVKRGELVFCDKLFYVSPFWYSLDNTKNKVDPYKDLAVDKYAIKLVRDAFSNRGTSNIASRKIYLPRKANQVRRLVNAEQVEALMIRNGFEIVYADQLTFEEQIKLFSSASIVVGGTGAALSNIVFMQPGTKAVIFSPKDLGVFNYYIFQQQADVAQVELMHLLGAPAKKENFYIHDDFYVDCDDLLGLIQRIG